MRQQPKMDPYLEGLLKQIILKMRNDFISLPDTPLLLPLKLWQKETVESIIALLSPDCNIVEL
jgi:hypothetical protein